MTDDQDKFCPGCDARRPWFEDDCPECGAALEPLPDRYALDPDRPLVGVLTTTNSAAVWLAKLALDDARIEHVIGPPDRSDMVGGGDDSTSAGSDELPWVVKVRATDADRARELLVDLEHTAASPETPLETSMEWARVLPPVELFESDTDVTVGHITDADLDWLRGQLDEGAVRDREFVLDPALIASYEQAGAEPSLLDVLRTALGSRRAVRLRWAFM